MIWANIRRQFKSRGGVCSLVPLGLTPENLVQAEECLFAVSEIPAGLRLSKTRSFTNLLP